MAMACLHMLYLPVRSSDKKLSVCESVLKYTSRGTPPKYRAVLPIRNGI